jgi:rubrerythrin
MRRRLMQKMRMSGEEQGGMFGSVSSSSMLGNSSSLNYYCMSCGTQHKDVSCPNCGSKMKKVGY